MPRAVRRAEGGHGIDAVQHDRWDMTRCSIDAHGQVTILGRALVTSLVT